MIILWGFRDKLLKPVFMGIRYCQNCNQFQYFYAMKHQGQFTLFFLPIFWWTKGYYIGCGTCERAKKLSKEEYLRAVQEYENFPDKEKTKTIYEFCVDMAANRENTEENTEKLFQQVKERFDLRGYDQDFKKMIQNIFIIQEHARNQPKILD